MSRRGRIRPGSLRSDRQHKRTPAHARLLEEARSFESQGRLTEAERLCQTLLQSDPTQADALNLLGVLRIHQGRYAEAMQFTGAAVRQNPGFAEAHNLLGVALSALGRREEAAASYRRAIGIRPDFALAHYNLANALSALERKEDAAASYGTALALRPDYAEAHNNLGNALNDLGRCEEAIASYGRALALRPDFAEAHSNLGSTLCDLHRYQEALASLQRALDVKGDYANAHYLRSLARLAVGDYDAGWPEFEWRWHVRGGDRKRAFREPLWLGTEALAGRSILLYGEQGFGDTLQFVRYAPLVAERGARVILQVPGSLRSLLAGLPGVDAVIAEGDPLPPFDYQCPLMSLPLAFRTTLSTIPASTPYLHAPTDHALRWKDRIGACAGLKVGVVWAGSARQHNPAAFKIDRRRSLALAQLEPLAAVTGVHWFSLQKGEPAVQARTPPPGMALDDYTEELRGFGDTAALVSQLDLVISVDTAVAHLAGAMGKPVWIISRFDACWRWLVGREDSPWYPTARLFRQPRMGDWDSVIERVRQELLRLSDQRP